MKDFGKAFMKALMIVVAVGAAGAAVVGTLEAMGYAGDRPAWMRADIAPLEGRMQAKADRIQADIEPLAARVAFLDKRALQSDLRQAQRQRDYLERRVREGKAKPEERESLDYWRRQIRILTQQLKGK